MIKVFRQEQINGLSSWRLHNLDGSTAAVFIVSADGRWLLLFRRVQSLSYMIVIRLDAALSQKELLMHFTPCLQVFLLWEFQ